MQLYSSSYTFCNHFDTCLNNIFSYYFLSPGGDGHCFCVSFSNQICWRCRKVGLCPSVTLLSTHVQLSLPTYIYLCAQIHALMQKSTISRSLTDTDTSYGYQLYSIVTFIIWLKKREMAATGNGDKNTVQSQQKLIKPDNTQIKARKRRFKIETNNRVF